MQILKRWVKTEAEWWQFWMPQSGGRGGIIMGIVILCVVAQAI
jgi:hypothetical protein